MAAEVGENHDSLVKELETLKSRLEEERLKLNDVARKLFCFNSYILIHFIKYAHLHLQFLLSLSVLRQWVK